MYFLCFCEHMLLLLQLHWKYVFYWVRFTTKMLSLYKLFANKKAQKHSWKSQGKKVFSSFFCLSSVCLSLHTVVVVPSTIVPLDFSLHPASLLSLSLTTHSTAELEFVFESLCLPDARSHSTAVCRASRQQLGLIPPHVLSVVHCVSLLIFVPLLCLCRNLNPRLFHCQFWFTFCPFWMTVHFYFRMCNPYVISISADRRHCQTCTHHHISFNACTFLACLEVLFISFISLWLSDSGGRNIQIHKSST